MSDGNGPGTSPRGQRHEHGWPEKRRAIAEAAMEVFVHDGFSRANVADVAEAAGVSKRTLYKHYGDKEQLFLTVVAEAFDGLRDRFTEIAERHLGEATDVEAALLAFGREWVTSLVLAPDMLAFRRLHIAEAPHFPALSERWREAGPALVQRVLKRHLSRFDALGLLRVPDPAIAAEQLAALVLYSPDSRALFDDTPIPQAEIDGYIENGIHAFMCTYAPLEPAASPGHDS